MHRLIMKALPGTGLVIDHQNGDGLDNRRSNLPPATGSRTHETPGVQLAGDFRRPTASVRESILSGLDVPMFTI
jgi:hypothetical protein